MATASDMINRSLRLIGAIGQSETPTAQESADSLYALNSMMDADGISRMMIPQMLEENFPLVASQASYTIGSGGNFNTTRPVRIESAFIRSTSGSDFPLQIIDNESYDSISLKTTTSDYPGYFYYENSFPLGKIYLWGAPSTAYTLYINSWKQLQNFTSLTTALSMPPGYQKYIEYNLAVEIAPEFGMTVPDLVLRGAVDSKAEVKRFNAPDSIMRHDPALIGNVGYDIHSGIFR